MPARLQRNESRCSPYIAPAFIPIVVAFTIFWCTGNAQNATGDAKKELNNASKFIDEKKYTDALTSANNARSAITRVIEDELSKTIPATLEEWEMAENSGPDLSIGFPQSRGTINAVRIFQKKQESSSPDTTGAPEEVFRLSRLSLGKNPVISVTVTNDYSLAAQVSQAHIGDENPIKTQLSSRQHSEPVKIKGYRALNNYYPEGKQGEITVVAGAGVVKVQGRNIESADVLKKFAEAVDYIRIKSLLGE